MFTIVYELIQIINIIFLITLGLYRTTAVSLLLFSTADEGRDVISS